MEMSFIIGVCVTWAVIALAKGADWLGGNGGHQEESEWDFQERVRLENMERARKKLEEMKKEKFA